MLLFINLKILECLCTHAEKNINETYCVQFVPKNIFKEELEMRIFESSILALLNYECDDKHIFYDQTNKILTCDRLFDATKCIFVNALIQSNKYYQNNDDLNKICGKYFDVKSKTYNKMLKYFKTEVYNFINFKAFNECTDEQNSKVIYGFTKSFLKHITSSADIKIFYKYSVKVNIFAINIRISNAKTNLISKMKHITFSVCYIPYEGEKNQSEGTKYKKDKYACISKFTEIKTCLQRTQFFNNKEVIFEIHLYRTLHKIISSSVFETYRTPDNLDYNQIHKAIFEQSFDFLKSLLADYNPHNIYKNFDGRKISVQQVTCYSEVNILNEFLVKSNLENFQTLNLAKQMNKIGVVIALISVHAIISFLNIENDVSNRFLNYVMTLDLCGFIKLIFGIDKNILRSNIIDDTKSFLEKSNFWDKGDWEVTKHFFTNVNPYMQNELYLFMINIINVF